MIDRRRRGRSISGVAYGVILLAGFAGLLAINLPGHLTVDSIIALAQGRSGVRETWAPAAFAWALGAADRLRAGTGLYVAAASAVLFASLLSLPTLRPRTAWTAPVAAALAVLTPQIAVYQGIVWRDVLFANLAVAGFVLLARAAARWSQGLPWASLLASALCLGVAAAVRQNGVVLVLAAVVALAWTARRFGGRPVVWGLAGLLATGVVAFGVVRLSEPQQTAPKLRAGAEVLILQHYDVVAVAARDPQFKLAEVARVRPDSARLIEDRAKSVYTPARIDPLDDDPDVRRALWRMPDAAMHAQWLATIQQRPGDYLAHRAEVFHWLIAPPDRQACTPFAVGVTGPSAVLARLGITPRADARDLRIKQALITLGNSPLFSHLAWLGLGLAAAAFLLIRRDPADLVVAALVLGAAIFAASFLAISVACDYRYLYPLDLAAITALLYVAVDPSLRRSGRL